jgi:hypothetical protein
MQAETDARELVIANLYAGRHRTAVPAPVTQSSTWELHKRLHTHRTLEIVQVPATQKVFVLESSETPRVRVMCDTFSS